MLTSSEGFSANDYLISGEIGSETTEASQPSNVNTSTHALTVPATNFAHSESTKVTIIKYNQVKFYHTATESFDVSEQVGSTQDLQVDNNYTVEYDTTNTTGFGWFVFYNSTTDSTSQHSNAIPYAGFGENSVKKIFDNFFSLLNNKETKLISNADAFSWLNESYAITINELNLINPSYTVPANQEIATVSGTKEYALEDNFAGIISVYDTNKDLYIEKIDLNKLALWDYFTSNVAMYYMRGNFIGFSPTPDETVDYEIRYKTNSSKLTSYYDNVSIPNNNYYLLVDYMMYRAAPKLGRTDGKDYYEAFKTGIERMKVTTHNREGGLDSWEPDPTSNV